MIVRPREIYSRSFDKENILENLIKGFPMKSSILVLSAYDAASHQQWRTTLSQLLPQFQWTQLALPPRHFSWRVRGNSLSWGFGDLTAFEQHYDLLIATSMVDLASLRGFVPALTRIPTLVYCHENQFAYPDNPNQPGLNHFNKLDAAMVSLYTALCADRLVFNSEYNRRTFLAGVSRLLRTLPDHVPAGIEQRLAGSSVLPVPVGLDLQAIPRPGKRNNQILELVWNHRWEHDKGIDLLLQVVNNVIDRNLPIRFHILGQQFRRQPGEFALIRKLLLEQGQSNPRLEPRLGNIADRGEYLSELAACDVVLSTARHDFQGLAVIEAGTLGCTPLCPADLAYPEYLDERFLYTPLNGQSAEQCATGIVDQLAIWLALKKQGKALPKFDSRRFSPHTLKESYLALLRALTG